MSGFFEQLDAETLQHGGDVEDWVYVPYDQLTDEIGPLSRLDPETTGIVLVETSWKGDRRPYHRQKLAITLANQRHFALEQARRGFAVQYIVDTRRYGLVLAQAIDELGPLTTMEPAERELRADISELRESGDLEVLPHDGWLTTPEQFRESQDEPPWRMDKFYRHVRRDTGILMEDGSPVGGKYSLDIENRESWSGEPDAPEPPTFELDDVTADVGEMIATDFGVHPGKLNLERVPATSEDCEAAWEWALSECMEHFGPYEDAMSHESRSIFHTRIAPILNLHRITPKRVVEDVVELDIPLNSKEGFIRQVLGWREFMHHVHRETDGFRDMPEGFDRFDAIETGEAPGDGGWERWSGKEWPRPKAETVREDPPELDGGALPSYLSADTPLPPAYWGEPSGLRCLDWTVEAVMEEGWTHHIPRLMVLSNIATLLDVDPRELTDWFWVAFADAFDWVVEPNVLGMGSFGLGDLFVTKPYVSGSNYIDKMSDFCADCRFDPADNCPLKRLYWAFLERHEDKLADNNRMNMVMASMRKRSDATKQRDRRIFEQVRETLLDGEELTPEDLTTPDDD